MKAYHNFKLHLTSNKSVELLKVNSRRRRSISERRYIEVMVVADEEMYEFYGAKEVELRRYMLSVMAVVSTLFLVSQYSY